KSGAELVLVSSGAVAAGMSSLGWSERPKTIHQMQAAAAIGQMGLVQAWESSFQAHGLSTAQVLLTHDDLSDRKRYLNARSTLRALLDLGVIPVVNENDTVVTDEIRFGDNDTLGALVTNLVEADLLVILTDRDGLYTADPRHNPEAELVAEAMADDPKLDAMAGGSAGALGRGGMLTKLRAARLAARSGAGTVIVGGRIEGVIERLQAGDELGTLLLPEKGMLAARKQWLAGHLQTRGRLLIDEGAVKALASGRRSLLPVGVTAIEGAFRRGEMVVCVGPDGREVARGLVNYSAQDASRILGQSTDAVARILGYIDEPEMVHRDNLVLV
ncbi:MAG: glutamate 5-kinase, partial [Pseudomonas sp.]